MFDGLVQVMSDVFAMPARCPLCSKSDCVPKNCDVTMPGPDLEAGCVWGAYGTITGFMRPLLLYEATPFRGDIAFPATVHHTLFKINTAGFFTLWRIFISLFAICKTDLLSLRTGISPCSSCRYGNVEKGD